MTMIARIAGKCSACGQRFSAGAPIEYSAFLRGRVHPWCAVSIRRLEREASEMLERYRQTVN